MKPLLIVRNLVLVVALIFSMAALSWAQSGGVDTTLVMAVGDSYVAGFQNGGLSIDGQPNGFASVVARQMGAFLPLPTITRPGIPPTLTISPTGAIVPSSAVPGSMILPPLGNSFHFDVAIPGFEVHDVLYQRPQLPDPVNRPGDILRDLILGIPSLVVPGSVNTGSEIEQVEALHPSFVIAWFGGNDVLGAFVANNAALITPFDQFATDYLNAMERLKATGAKIVTGNIPNVTASPLYIPVEVIALQAGAPLSVIGPILGVSPGDSVYLPAITLVQSILSGHAAGPLPRQYVMTAATKAAIKAALDQENSFIAGTAADLGIPMADFNGVLNNVLQNGLVVGGKVLTTGPLGGILSLDFIHPTNTGYAFLANEMIRAINAGYGTNYPQVDLNLVFAKDPLAPYVGLFSLKSGQPTEGASLFDLKIDRAAFDDFVHLMSGSETSTVDQETPVSMVAGAARHRQ